MLKFLPLDQVALPVRGWAPSVTEQPPKASAFRPIRESAAIFSVRFMGSFSQAGRRPAPSNIRWCRGSAALDPLSTNAKERGPSKSILLDPTAERKELFNSEAHHRTLAYTRYVAAELLVQLHGDRAGPSGRDRSPVHPNHGQNFAQARGDEKLVRLEELGFLDVAQRDGKGETIGTAKQIRPRDARQDPRLFRRGHQRATFNEKYVGRRSFENVAASIDDECLGCAAQSRFANRQKTREIVGDLGPRRRRGVRRPGSVNDDGVDPLLVGLGRR